MVWCRIQDSGPLEIPDGGHWRDDPDWCHPWDRSQHHPWRIRMYGKQMRTKLGLILMGNGKPWSWHTYGSVMGHVYVFFLPALKLQMSLGSFFPQPRWMIEAALETGTLVPTLYCSCRWQIVWVREDWEDWGGQNPWYFRRKFSLTSIEFRRNLENSCEWQCCFKMVKTLYSQYVSIIQLINP